MALGIPDAAEGCVTDPAPTDAEANPTCAAEARSPWQTRGPVAALIGLWFAALAVRPDVISSIGGAVCVLAAWAWLRLPVHDRPNHRHPHLRKVARRPRVVAWRTRDRWLPAARPPALWALVFGGLLGVGALLGYFIGSHPIWWTLSAPALLLTAALLLDTALLMVFGFWLVMVPMMLLFGAIPFFVEGAARPVAIGLPIVLVGLWFADLGRALYGGRAQR